MSAPESPAAEKTPPSPSARLGMHPRPHSLDRGKAWRRSPAQAGSRTRGRVRPRAPSTEGLVPVTSRKTSTSRLNAGPTGSTPMKVSSRSNVSRRGERPRASVAPRLESATASCPKRRAQMAIRGDDAAQGGVPRRHGRRSWLPREHYGSVSIRELPALCAMRACDRLRWTAAPCTHRRRSPSGRPRFSPIRVARARTVPVRSARCVLRRPRSPPP